MREILRTVDECSLEHYYWRVAIPPQRRLQTIQDSSLYLKACWYAREAWRRLRTKLVIWAIVPNAEGQVMGSEARVEGWIL